MNKISFVKNGLEVSLSSNGVLSLYTKLLDWLDKNGYDFKGDIHNIFVRKVFNNDELDEILSKSNYILSNFYNINNSGKYIFTSKGNIDNRLKNIFLILKNFGVDESTIKTEGFETRSRIKKFDEIDNELESEDFIETIDKSKKMTFLVACQFVLKQNDNRPMNANEIWEEIKKQNLVNTSGLTPWDTINAQMILYSTNSTAKNKKKNSIFQIIEGTKPYKFILLNPDNIQDVPDEDEIEEPIENIKVFSKNPFRQAICVLGGSGTGKSVTIENILEEEDHEFDQIIPSASTTGLLSQFSPSKSGYVPSKLGKMIVKAYDNPTELFTAVFDECHKSNIIEMINDELLQAISTKRNAGKRFISLDDDTAELYPGTETYRGNILMPDNLGFIFISSKPDVIIHNDDFFNRIDIVLLKSYEEERLSTIDQLLGKVLSSTEKDSLKSNNE